MRGSDVGLGNKLCSMPAFWGGLLYDQSALDAAWDLVKASTTEQRQTLRYSVPKLGLKAEFMGQSLQALGKQVLEIARNGLKSRRFGEEAFLDVLDEEVHSGQTQADKLLQLYHGAWKGDISHVFKASAY